MSASPTIKQLTLIGVGLIGGSFALDLKRQNRVDRVVGIDTDANNLARALERKVIDEAFSEINSTSVGQSDLIVIATPVATLPEICRTLAPLVDKNTVITDVGSTKQSTVDAFYRYLPKQLRYCVAAHPIAGSDRNGALAAQFGLYQDKKLIICPHELQDETAIELIESLWQAVGAQVYRMQAQQHDAIFAAVSHMPHLVAFSYVHQMLDHPDGAQYLKFAASGFRDFSRIASSHPAIWTDIFLANKESLLALIEGQQQQLQQLATLLRENDRQELYRYFEEAKQTRDRWQSEQ